MGKKILFIEDEKGLQKTLGEVLQQEGFDVLQAYDGEEGVELVKNEKPALVLLDLILPKKDGYEVLEELKNDDKTKDIPVIVLTNLESADDIQRALDAGAKTYLVKANYELEEILSKIRKTLEDAQQAIT